MIAEVSSGLSPRLRGNPMSHSAGIRYERSIPAPAGNRRVDGLPCEVPGSIPAPAGEPSPPIKSKLYGRVYPAPAGEPRSQGVGYRKHRSIPAPAGNLLKEVPKRLPSGSIPAPAGEPLLPGGDWVDDEVYPRACGGNRGRGRVGALDVRSIPAPAGEPPMRSRPVGQRGSIPAPAGEPLAGYI